MTPTDRILTVSQLTEELRETLETRFSEVWVSGEISNLRQQQSGHCYFTLKDAGAQLTAVVFRREAMRLRFALRNGLEVAAFGRISVYPPRGNYQLICSFITETGSGRLQQKFEELKRRLGEEGLFDRERKKPIPRLPRSIAIITSPTGAAIRDFISILRRRKWHGRVTVLPVRVQGVEAAPEIVSAIADAQAANRFDLLVVARGGGSLEDLWPFNEEPVVRALAACRIPTISAIGHEIDFALTDFAADARAETPSAAAELISSNYIDACQRLERSGRDLARAVMEHFVRRSAKVELLQSRLKAVSPQARLERAYLHLDDVAARLQLAVDNRLRDANYRLERLGSRLAAVSPKHAVQLSRQRVEQLGLRLLNASPEKVLKRGFTMIKDQEGRIVPHKSALGDSTSVNIIFADGEVPARLAEGQQELPF